MKRIKYISILAGLVFLMPWQAVSQQQALYSQYMMNDFLLNPAIAGTSEFSPLRITARSQWTGIEGAPQTQAISGHTMLGRNEQMGAGGYIYNDAFGPVSRTGIMGAYSYKVRVKNSTMLSFGLSVSAFQFKFNESGFNIIDDSDVVFNGATESTFVPDANFGMYLYNKKYFVGFSSAQLFQFQINIPSASDVNKTVRHHFLTAGYKFTISDEFEAEPSFLVKSTELTKPQLDVNAKIIYKKNYWLGFSYRTEDAAIAMIGLMVDRYYLAYAFDYTLSGLNNYTMGSHEIMIGINLTTPKQTKALI